MANITQALSGRLKGEPARLTRVPNHAAPRPLPTYPFLSGSWLLLADDGAFQFCVRRRVSVSQGQDPHQSSAHTMPFQGPRGCLRAGKGRAATSSSIQQRPSQRQTRLAAVTGSQLSTLSQEPRPAAPGTTQGPEPNHNQQGAEAEQNTAPQARSPHAHGHTPSCGWLPRAGRAP